MLACVDVSYYPSQLVITLFKHVSTRLFLAFLVRQALTLSALIAEQSLHRPTKQTLSARRQILGGKHLVNFI